MDINQFNQFAKGNAAYSGSAKTAIAYTRVSTKEQADNNQSLATQAKYIKNYAAKNGLEILSEFGGTYESAKTDERVEFNRMLRFAKKSKVDLILVYSIDRFSRSGPNAIYISEQLRKANIGIMSVTQPIDSMTASGELQQNIYFIFSQYENMQRREKSMAGTKEMLLKGEWVTKPPLGYNIVRTNGSREIIINQKGEFLRQAFKKKIKNNTSFKELSKWLKARGVIVSNKRLSELSRNVFYCGYMAHSALEGTVVNGNHKGILTQKEFMALNDVLAENNISRVTVNKKDNDNLPLKGLLICSSCKTKMTGYLVKKKNLYYYKCNTIGCKTNKSAKTLHGRLEELLESLQIDEKYIAPIKEQFIRTLDSKKEFSHTEIIAFKNGVSSLKTKLEKVEERYAIGEIDFDMYSKFSRKYQADLEPLEKQIQQNKNNLSNHREMTEEAVHLLCNLLNIWTKADYNTKQKLLDCIYPEGIVLDKQKMDYRTFNLNPAILCISDIATSFSKSKKQNSQEIPDYSALVARSRIERTSNV